MKEFIRVMKGLWTEDSFSFDGKFYRYRDYVVQARPVQKPHPPIWYGAPNADAIAWAAPNRINVVSLGPASRARAIADRYRQEWTALGHDAAMLPHVGITRHIVVAETDADAQRIAGAAYLRWRQAMDWIWRRSNVDFILKEIYPEDFAALAAIGHGVAGSPATVRDYIAGLQAETGINYVLGQMVFGDMSADDATNSLRLFAREVMPEFA